jgi:hypothetical protein
MSASFSKKDSFTFMANQQELPKLTASYLEMLFDKYVDEDIEIIKKEMSMVKLIKRDFIVKTLLFPIEATLTLLFVGREGLGARVNIQKIYWSFLRNKLSLSELNYKLERLV